mgnify:CR=1 FL=1
MRLDRHDAIVVETRRPEMSAVAAAASAQAHREAGPVSERANPVSVAHAINAAHNKRHRLARPARRASLAD